MRHHTPHRFTPADSTPHGLRLVGERGERFQLTALDHDLIRVQMWPDGAPRIERTWWVVGADGDVPREGRRRDDLSPFALPHITLDDAGALATDALRVSLDPDSLRLTWATREGVTLAEDLRGRAYGYDRAGRAVFHYLLQQPGERYYGFGERSGTLDKAGRRMRMVNLDALGYDAETSDPLYKHFPFYITYLPAHDLAYGLFYDNMAACVFDMGAEIDAFWGSYRYYQADDGDLDCYFIFGPTIGDVVEKFARLTGRPCLMPRWSLGYLGSTMAYTEAPDAQAQLARFVALCAQHDIPCDMFHLSSGYSTDPETGRRYVFTWNRQRVPDPHAMTAAFHQGGMQIAANVKPYLLTTHPRYGEVAALGGLIRDAETDAPALSSFWSGGINENALGGHLDFTGAGFDWWKARLKDALFAYGIDAAWNDNNEFQLWDDAARCANGLPIGMARPLQTLLMARASYEAAAEHRPDVRPFVLTRSGCPGIQRYAQSWSGDNFTSWKTLRYNIPMGLGLSLSGMPNTGHDIGGFYGPAPDPELFVRWVQCGVFHPRFTIHSFNSDGTVNEPWMYPEVLPLIREALRLRYRLIPYLYSLLWEAAQTGRPIIRPTVYHFSADPHTHNQSFEFLLGSHLLVAPIFEPGAATRAVYLPAGERWCDWHTGAWYEGGQRVTVDAPLDRIPLFARAGAVIPMGKAMRHVGAEPDDERTLMLFPHSESGTGEFTLYEDDGHSTAYRQGAFTTVTVTMRAAPEQIEVHTQRQGSYPLPYAQWQFVLPKGEGRPLVQRES